jgi:Carboxypeptidase regulatory-like domain
MRLWTWVWPAAGALRERRPALTRRNRPRAAKTGSASSAAASPPASAIATSGTTATAVSARMGIASGARAAVTMPPPTAQADSSPATSAPIQRTYQWRRCDSAGANCLDIASATDTTYTLTAADIGRTIRVHETATNAYGGDSADSPATATVKVKPGTIAGTVKSSRKAPIAAATVNCGSAGTATTSATGAYSIANAPPGTYTCTASANGYAPNSQQVKVSSGQQTTANFSLVPR